MLTMFLKRGKGSISVFVTVIMVPVVFFIGFLVDLSRIKFCGNQAVMAADNYGEAILTDYDNLLKELYGLFSLTQNNKGMEALDRLDSYVEAYKTTSFRPNENLISFGHLQEVTAKDAYEGWMPYGNADLTLEAVPVEGASLSTPEIFNTQIGDFMKFRIVQTIGDDEQGMFDAIEDVKGMNNTIEAVDKQQEIAEKAAEALKAAREYYVSLEGLWQYPDYIGKIAESYSTGKSSMDGMLNGDYAYYKAYMDEDPQAIENALEHRAKIEEQEAEKAALEAAGNTVQAAQIVVEELTAEEARLCQIDDDYSDHLGHSPQPLQEVFDKAADGLRERIEWEKELRTSFEGGTAVSDLNGHMDVTVNFINFDQKAQALQTAADKLQGKMGDLMTLREQLDEILNRENVNQGLKERMEEEMSDLDELFWGNGEYTADDYVALATHLQSFSGQNSAYKAQAERMLDSMVQRGSEAIVSHPDVSALPQYEEALDQGKIADYHGGYDTIYTSLQDCFGSEDPGSTKKEAEKKQDAADNLLKEIGDQLNNEPQQKVQRDIPAGGDFAGMGDYADIQGFNLVNMLKDAAGNFKSISLENAGNRLWTKLYLVQYDFGMFSSRVTNVNEDDGAETQVSLTGYPMAPNINYLYQSEIEYLLGGHNSSQANLNSARNKILGFRVVMNLISTYTVKEINSAIEGVSDAFAAIPVAGPALKIIVAAALRLAVAGVETYADWELLKEGESVCVLKNNTGDLSLFEVSGLADKMKDLLGKDISSGTKSGDPALNYEQYLTIMMIFLTRSETLTERTSHLITLNVNTVKQKIGSEGELSELEFKMEDTVTAVDVTCAVQMNLVVMPKNFAKRTVDAGTYGAIEQFEGNTYKFTVTRGY